MRTCFPIALLCVSTLCSTATSAAPLDSFTAKQSAISTRSRASTRLVEGARNSTWAARTFITEARGICKQGTPSSATLGTDGNGSVFFQSNNTQGTSSITWELKPALKGRAIGEVRFEVFDASPITSPPPSPVTLTAFVKVEDNDKTTYTISTKATLKGASRRRSLFFNLKDRLPQNISASLLRPTRITIGIRQLDRCETLVGIRRVSFSEKPFPGPVDLLRAGRQQSAAKKPVKPSSVQAISAAAPQMSPSPVASPTVMTCANEYPDVIMEKINECLRQVHKSDSPPSECADVSCECTDHAGKDYTIEVVQSNVQPKGTACLQTNTTCKMQDGLCNEFGRCVPKALVDVNPDDFGFIDNPDADMSEQCLNRTKSQRCAIR